jgi:hypothetical protein
MAGSQFATSRDIWQQGGGKGQGSQLFKVDFDE